jgi:hypothetical protein
MVLALPYGYPSWQCSGAPVTGATHESVQCIAAIRLLLLLLLLLHVGSMHVHRVPGRLVHAMASGGCSQVVPAGEPGSGAGACGVQVTGALGFQGTMSELA